MCQIASIGKSRENGETTKMSPNGYSLTINNSDQHTCHHLLSNGRNSPIDINSNTKHLASLYIAALHLRQRMREENLIHPSYSAYLNGENNPRSLFHNCFHSYETIEWLKKQQLCKTSTDGLEIFQVLEKLLIIHHVCDFNQFEYPTNGSTSSNTIKYLYRFRLDDGTADQNKSFHQFASIYETYTSLFTLDKNQCRGIDLRHQPLNTNPYEEQPGILLKGDNLARMIAFRSATNMQNIERIAEDMIMYGFVRFDQCEQGDECVCAYHTLKFHNDDRHQYALNVTYRLSTSQRLDLVALMQPDIFSTLMISCSPTFTRSEHSPFVSASCPDRTPSLTQFQNKMHFNRTRSNYHCHDSLKKEKSSYSNHSHDHCTCSAYSSPSQIKERRSHQVSDATTSSNSSLLEDEFHVNRRISHGDELDCTTKLTCTVNTNDIHRRRKSVSLNSPASANNRPSAEDLEKLEHPWCWKSFSLKRDRRGYGLILRGQGPCYVERIDPYGSAYTSGIRVNEYIYAVEGVNVLRRSGKEVERLLSMFDKCTIYTVYNREDYPQTSTPPNELHVQKINSIKQSSSFLSTSSNDHNNNNTNSLLTTAASAINDTSPSAVTKVSLFSSSPQQQQQQQNSSLSSSIEGASSCSISPKASIAASTATKRRTLSKPFSFFKFNGRSSNPTTTSSDGSK